MQATSVLLCVATLVVAVLAAPNDQAYSTKYDNIDIDKLLKNDRVVTSYVQCLLYKGPCTPEGREFRQRLPDALNTNCSKCNPAQKNIIRKATSHIIANRPSDWNEIRKKYDPTGAKRTSFEAFLRGTN